MKSQVASQVETPKTYGETACTATTRSAPRWVVDVRCGCCVKQEVPVTTLSEAARKGRPRREEEGRGAINIAARAFSTMLSIFLQRRKFDIPSAISAACPQPPPPSNTNHERWRRLAGLKERERRAIERFVKKRAQLVAAVKTSLAPIVVSRGRRRWQRCRRRRAWQHWPTFRPRRHLASGCGIHKRLRMGIGCACRDAPLLPSGRMAQTTTHTVFAHVFCGH